MRKQPHWIPVGLLPLCPIYLQSIFHRRVHSDTRKNVIISGVVMMINIAILPRKVIKYRNTLRYNKGGNHVLLAKKVNQMWRLESQKESQSWSWQLWLLYMFSVRNLQNSEIYFSSVSISRSLSCDEEFPNNRERTLFKCAFPDRHRWLWMRNLILLFNEEKKTSV